MARREATAEQKAASIERRNKAREAWRLVAAMGEADRQALLDRTTGGLVVTVEGRTLSGHNQLFIASQAAGTTVVGGFHQWRAAGRMVRKGEHGLSIWVPCLNKKESAGGEEIEGAGKLRFIMGVVFDISQTQEAETQVAEVA